MKIANGVSANKEPEILFENAQVVVLNKPAGLVVHGDGKTKEPTVTDWLVKKYPKIASVGEPLKLASGEIFARPGIVHRLDRDTSGVLLVAKTQPAYLFFKRQFQDRDIKKIYNAFVYGKVAKEVGVISSPIARSRHDFRQFTVEDDNRGKERDAVTHYIRIKQGVEASYLELIPKTGRTHQIRVHLKSIGHPIIGDNLYASSRPALLGFKRLALHARKIEFALPKGERVSVEAPLPADFVKAGKELGVGK